MRECALHLIRIFKTTGGRRIPKGFRLEAQGCEERATLGLRWGGWSNPERVPPAFRLSGLRNSAATLSGLEFLGAVTQGSSFLATLGWRTQSLWD